MIKKVEHINLLFSLLYFIGVISLIFCLLKQENSVLCGIAEAVYIIGFVGAAIPDVMINAGITAISITEFRIMLINRNILFFLIHSLWLVNEKIETYIFAIVIIILLSGIADFILEIKFFAQIKRVGITTETLRERIRQVDTKKIEGLENYFILYMVGILFLMELNQSYVELLSMIFINVCIQIFITIKMSKKAEKKRMPVLCVGQWAVFMITMAVSVYGHKMIACYLIGSYIMFTINLIQGNKTSFFNKGC